MKRWTDREGIDTKVYYDGARQTYDSNQEEAYKKLCKILDLERELGIDLIKAIELCKQVNSKKVVYTKENWGIDTLKIIDELDIELFSHRLYKNAYGIYISLDLYEYGKTWALTREELEDDGKQRNNN